jgi:hypothetical protein
LPYKTRRNICRSCDCWEEKCMISIPYLPWLSTCWHVLDHINRKGEGHGVEQSSVSLGSLNTDRAGYWEESQAQGSSVGSPRVLARNWLCMHRVRLYKV